jgi:D-aminopeptidase
MHARSFIMRCFSFFLFLSLFSFPISTLAASFQSMSQDTTSTRPRARDVGVAPGILSPGPFNAITDVTGIRVGHVTLIQGNDIRTGATAILPHGGNIYQDKVPAGIVVGNGFGKLMGSTQIMELGEIETPIVLTNTLSVPRAADAILDWTLSRPGNEEVRSVNTVVGETNDGGLNDIRRRVLTSELILQAIESATDGSVEEGSVGAGTGTTAFGWKGGIGTSSRVLPASLGGYTVGVLVQSNFGGVLQILGAPVGQVLGQYYLKRAVDKGDADGSIMIIVATDAPLSDRNLTRLARRALAGLARTGASMTNGSGDYVLAFSTAESVRRTPERRNQVGSLTEVPNNLVSPLFQAVIETTEEAIYNSLFKATTIVGLNGHRAEALPMDQVLALLNAHNLLAH